MGLDEAVDLLHAEPFLWRRVDCHCDKRRVRRLVLPSSVREGTLWKGGRGVLGEGRVGILVEKTINTNACNSSDPRPNAPGASQCFPMLLSAGGRVEGGAVGWAAHAGGMLLSKMNNRKIRSLAEEPLNSRRRSVLSLAAPGARRSRRSCGAWIAGRAAAPG